MVSYISQPEISKTKEVFAQVEEGVVAWAFYLVMLLAVCLFEIAVFEIDALAIHKSLSLAFALQ